jgi:hypothetical protein
MPSHLPARRHYIILIDSLYRIIFLLIGDYISVRIPAARRLRHIYLYPLSKIIGISGNSVSPLLPTAFELVEGVLSESGIERSGHTICEEKTAGEMYGMVIACNRCAELDGRTSVKPE